MPLYRHESLEEVLTQVMEGHSISATGIRPLAFKCIKQPGAARGHNFPVFSRGNWLIFVRKRGNWRFPAIFAIRFNV
jgi:hypothetical protein